MDAEINELWQKRLHLSKTLPVIFKNNNLQLVLDYIKFTVRVNYILETVPWWGGQNLKREGSRIVIKSVHCRNSCSMSLLSAKYIKPFY